jgi:hypothetical protein
MCQGGSSTNRPDGSNAAYQNLCCFDGQPLTKLGQEISFFGNGTLETKCPQRTQNTSVSHLIDGCSAPVPNAQDPMQNGFYFYGLLSVASTAFGQDFRTAGNPTGSIPNSGAAGPLACNQHDICYQSCAAPGVDMSAARLACDQGMQTRMNNTCAAAYPSTCPSSYSLLQCGEYFIQRADCFSWSDTFYAGLRVGGFGAFQERQGQYCKCCQ